MSCKMDEGYPSCLFFLFIFFSHYRKKTGAAPMRFAYFVEIGEILGERISNRGGHTIATGIRGVIFTRPSVTSTVTSYNPSLFIDNPVLNQYEV